MSPLIFKEQREFDRRSRCFAYDGDILIGYHDGEGNLGFLLPR
jgi:hypothetical protein